MASEYFLEPEINLVTENTENILSEGEQGSKRVLGERAGLGREGVGQIGWKKKEKCKGRSQTEMSFLGVVERERSGSWLGWRGVSRRGVGSDEGCGLVEGGVSSGCS